MKFRVYSKILEGKVFNPFDIIMVIVGLILKIFKSDTGFRLLNSNKTKKSLAVIIAQIKNFMI